MIGVAARSGIALGLNLQSNYNNMHSSSVEARVRVWWVIFYLEHLLSTMTSRTSCIGDGSCSTYPPLPVGEDQHEMPNIRGLFNDKSMRENLLYWTLYQTREQSQSRREWLLTLDPGPPLYFFYLTDLTMIIHTVTNRVYSTEVLRDGWAQIEGRMGLYSVKLDDWLYSLHPSFTFADESGHPVPGFTSRYQVSLALIYYSARIILSRPCLTRPDDNKDTGIKFPRSRFGNDTALVCLQASLSLISVFPDQPDAAWAYNISPWWSTLHFLAQATTIVLIHMSVGPVPVASEGRAEQPGGGGEGTAESPDIVLATCKKALCWLHCLGGTDRRLGGLLNSTANLLIASLTPGDWTSTTYPPRPCHRRCPLAVFMISLPFMGGR
jgi:hypothetical protein